MKEKKIDNFTKLPYRRVLMKLNLLVRVFFSSQCINQMKELKEQCEERIDELRKKNSDVPQIKENKDVAEDSRVWFG